MPTVMLTAKSVLALPAPEGAGRIDYWDEKAAGLVLRVTAKARTYSVWYRIHGAPRRLTLGPAEEISLADARALAADIRTQMRKGVDAVALKRTAAAEAQKARLVGETFAELTARYLESAVRGDGMKRGEALAPRTLNEYRRIIKADVLRPLGGIAPGEITKAHVRALVDSIRAEGHPVHANRVLATVKSVFSWALRKDLVATSPCAGLAATREHPRERVYSDAELRSIVEAVPGTELESLVPLILFTATRSEEARSARWVDVDLERRVWTIPDVKQGGTHVLPLSTGAMKVLAGIRRMASPFVFPAPTKGGYVDHPQKAVLKIRERSGVSDFRLHTLRTTVRTRLSELGVAPDVGERILGHTMERIRSIYDKHDYVPQMRLALETWARTLTALVSSAERKAAEVVPILRRSVGPINGMDRTQRR
jgi:integrase